MEGNRKQFNPNFSVEGPLLTKLEVAIARNPIARRNTVNVTKWELFVLKSVNVSIVKIIHLQNIISICLNLLKWLGRGKEARNPNAIVRKVIVLRIIVSVIVWGGIVLLLVIVYNAKIQLKSIKRIKEGSKFRGKRKAGLFYFLDLFYLEWFYLFFYKIRIKNSMRNNSLNFLKMFIKVKKSLC